MTVTPTALEGVLIVEPRVFRDDRGWFLESWNQAAFTAAGLDLDFVQDNHSRSAKGVVRGIHYQDMTAPMDKLVRCTAGAVFDVAVDLRAGSRTFGQWVAVELTAENAKQLWVPAGFGHGFQALTEGAEVQYKCTAPYAPQAEGAIRWDDPDLAIAWPIAAALVSPKDATAPSFAAYRRQPAFA
ncbi:MAG: dTDP-4-dehydrorhamnose 3,5-epimerase [Dehalococcoidia bacterium]